MGNGFTQKTANKRATATACDAVLPERPEPALIMMDSPTFPEGDRVDRSDLHEVPCGDSKGCASTARSEPRGELVRFSASLLCRGALADDRKRCQYARIRITYPNARAESL